MTSDYGWRVKKRKVIIYAFESDLHAYGAVVRTAQRVGTEYDATLTDNGSVVFAVFYVDAVAPQERRVQIDEIISTFREEMKKARG